MGVEDMVRCCTEWLSDPNACNTVGQAAKRVVLDNQGALKRSLELIETCLTTATTADSSLRSSSLVVREAYLVEDKSV